MKALNIDWLSDCPACGHSQAMVKTENGWQDWLYDGDTVECLECGHKGVVEVIDSECVDAAWDEVPADGQ